MASKTRIWRWKHSGFHGLTDVSVKVPAISEPGDVVGISDVVARRLQRAVCGMSDCKCGEGGSVCEVIGHGRNGNYLWGVRLPEYGAMVRGHYPQNR